MLTTLQLARKLARAARRASSDDDAATAVLETMHRTSSWFCRMSEDQNGLTVDEPYDVEPRGPRPRPRSGPADRPLPFEG